MVDTMGDTIGPMVMAMDTMAARRGKLKLPQRLTPGTTMAMPTGLITMAATTDLTATMAMDSMAARRGKLKLLLRLIPLPNLKLTPGTTMAMLTGPTTMAATTMATRTMAMATMDKLLQELPYKNFLWHLDIEILCFTALKLYS